MDRRKKGFTLIELLVVIAIIALLISLLLPALNNARLQAMGAVCLANQKGLPLTWTMYAADNRNDLVGGTVLGNSATGYDTVADREFGYVFPPQDDEGNPVSGSVFDPPTETQRLNGMQAGMLGSYLGTATIYRCPSDRSIDANPPLNKFRSYAITGSMNGEDTDSGSTQYGVPFENLDEISSPASKLVFVEEYDPGQSWLLGSFQVRIHETGYAWWDFLAIWHNESGTIGFADGHAEIKKWVNEETADIARAETRDEARAIAGAFPPELNLDLEFLGRAYRGKSR